VQWSWCVEVRFLCAMELGVGGEVCAVELGVGGEVCAMVRCCYCRCWG